MPARVQHPAPDFTREAVVNGEFREVTLADFAGRHLLLFFYPLDFTFVCPTEIIAFGDRLAEFNAINTDVVAASIDSKYAHLAWWQTPRDKGGIAGVKLPLIADVDRTLATDYGVLNEDGVALRGLFIIDPKGMLRHSTINDLGIGRSVDEALRVVQAIQFVDAHGEVCPANWQPGRDTIKPEPDASQSFFKRSAAG
jgi:alkyl hydroperoxide reductase subunit AhpC